MAYLYVSETPLVLELDEPLSAANAAAPTTAACGQSPRVIILSHDAAPVLLWGLLFRGGIHRGCGLRGQLR